MVPPRHRLRGCRLEPREQPLGRGLNALPAEVAAGARDP